MDNKITTIIKAFAYFALTKLNILKPKTGGSTDSAKYCYAIWLIHLKKATVEGYKHKNSVISEIGPGNSFGVGLSALLSGVSSYTSLDIFKYKDYSINLKLLDELIIMFQNKEPIPDLEEFPNVKPILNDYSFPNDIITDDILKDSLSPIKLKEIRREIENIIEGNQHSNEMLKILIRDTSNKIENSVLNADLILSQAVLEHVENLEVLFEENFKVLKPGGLASHTIDFKSHGTHKLWDGHWTYGGSYWQAINLGRTSNINRVSFYQLINILKSKGFTILNSDKYFRESNFNDEQFISKYSPIDNEDMKISEAYIIAKKDREI